MATEEVVAEKKLHQAAEPPMEAVTPEKQIDPPPQDDSKALTNAPQLAEKKSFEGSIDRDVALAKIEEEKRLSFIKAWEERERSRVDNRAQKKLSEVSSWENSKRASLDAQLRKLEEELEKKKAEYAEKMKNKVALLRKQAEERRAIVEAKRGEEILKAEEKSARYRAAGHVPKDGFRCFKG